MEPIKFVKTHLSFCFRAPLFYPSPSHLHSLIARLTALVVRIRRPVMSMRVFCSAHIFKRLVQNLKFQPSGGIIQLIEHCDIL